MTAYFLDLLWAEWIYRANKLQCNNTIQCNKIYLWLKRNKQLKQNSSEHLNPT
jgi:hypothetical protein